MAISALLQKRYSPRAFSEQTVSDEQIKDLFEAARWAPSSMNEQPWNYIYAKRGSSGFDKLISCLVPANQLWAKNAALLVLSIAKTYFNYKNRPNRHALHDTGAANLSICLQATEMGLQAHQMGGFDMDITMQTFNIDANEHTPVCFIAVGYPGNPESLPENLKERELAPRKRKQLQDFIKETN